MALLYGDISSSRAREVNQSDIRVASVSAPAGGSSHGVPVLIVYSLESDALSPATVIQVEYSTDGKATFGNAATADTGHASHSGTTSLAVDADGNTYTFAWDSKTDLTTVFQNTTMGVRVRATDGTAYSPWVESAEFEIDMLPAAPTLVSPDHLYFDRDTTPAFVFLCPEDPGADRIHFRVEIDNDSAFDTPDIDHNSVDNVGVFSHLIDSSPGTKDFANRQRYYVKDVSVTSFTLTTVAYSSLTNHHTGAAIPTTLVNPQIIIMNKADRPSYIDPSTITTTGFNIAKSAAGAVTNGLVDLIIWDDATVDFDTFWVDLTGVADNTAYTYGAGSFTTDILSQAIPASIANCRPMILEGNDSGVYMESISDTGFTLRLSVGSVASTATLRVGLRATPTEAYISITEAITSFTATAVDYSDAFDDSTNGGASWPDYIPASTLMPMMTKDRKIVVGTIHNDEASFYKSASGGSSTAEMDIHCGSEADASVPYWTDVSVNGVPDTFEGEQVRYITPDASAFATGFWYWRTRAANLS